MSVSDAVHRKKAAVGIVAIALLLAFTILAVLGFISGLVWIIADCVVAAAANLIFRRIGRPQL